MKRRKKTQNVKMNLTLSREFYELLQDNARKDFMRVATYTKQVLMKSLWGHKPESNSIMKDETTMEN